MPTSASSLLALLPDAAQRKAFATLDPGAGLVLHICSTAAEADRLQIRIIPDVILAGRNANPDWLSQVRERDADVYRILWTSTTSLLKSIVSVNSGQADAVLVNDTPPDEIIGLIHHGCEQALLRRHTRSLVDELAVRNAELLDFNERLEDLVVERTRHLVEAQDRLQESQRQMVQLETQATVSHLLRGLAHEFNNPLAAIYGYSQRLRRQHDANADTARRLDVILQEVEHCRTVVNQLRQLATPLTEPITKTDPETVLTDAGARITAAGGRLPCLDANEGLPSVMAAPRALIKVFEQIVANAADAGACNIWLSGELLGDRVRLVIENDGETPSQDVVESAVRPFFTTRAGDDRRGLGLSTAAALLREQDGTIELTQRHGAPGAAIIMLLPAGDPDQKRSSSSHLLPIVCSQPAAPVQVPTTLVIDDEPMVAEILVDALRDAGCTTATAGSIAEGMAEMTRLNVCALVVDLNLPDGSGLDFARRALALRPELAGHIALATGDNDRDHLDRLVAEHGFPVLGKPFRLDDVRALAELIR